MIFVGTTDRSSVLFAVINRAFAGVVEIPTAPIIIFT
jgi:hypothetical protein